MRKSTPGLRPGALVTALAVLGACGPNEVTVTDDRMANGEAFVRVAREALKVNDATASSVSGSEDSFYIAINKRQLEQRWFLSAYLTQWHPSENIPMRSLGTRVVSFKVQNGKLFMFDVADGKRWSDVLDPTVLIESYPIITDNAKFNRLANASSYVLFDPSAGLNRFSFVSEELAGYEVRFNVELSYLSRFRDLGDGVAFDQVFTGTSDVPAPGYFAYEHPFRGSGTLTITLRKYRESEDFVPSPLTSTNFFSSSNVQYVENTPYLSVNAVKWNIKPGMRPIPWRITGNVAQLVQDYPELEGIDVQGAIERGVTNWNKAFGFPVFTIVPVTSQDSPGDDDKNFIVLDRNPSAGYAFANWRENPNTGEIRGASVYFSSVFIEGAIWGAPTDPPPAADGGTALVRGPSATGALRMSWDAFARDPVCQYRREPLSTRAIPAGMTRKQYIEDVITHTILHEIGHTLGLRHNFKGSLTSSSVMDYLIDPDAVNVTSPAPYDVAAVRYLYGLASARPTQPFCTDQNRLTDAQCDLFDTGSDPLTMDVGPAFRARVRGFLARTSSLSYSTIHRLTRYVRAPASNAQRLAALSLLVEDVAPPLKKEIADLGPLAPAYADLLADVFLSQLFLDPAAERDEIAVTPSLADPAFRAKVVGTARAVLMNTDAIRSFQSRRTMVDLLKALQTADAYQALLDARPALVYERSTVTGSGQALVDDLIKRLDAATSPYFR